MNDRLINIARDKSTERILYANELTYDTRLKFNEGLIVPICLECGQVLSISRSIYDRHFFKHLPNHSFCLLSSNFLSPKEQKEYLEILEIKESDRHKELKNKIGNYLINVNGVEKESVNIDNKFIIKNNEKRKPDVYCKFNGHEIVFEIQLSKLPLWYILRRNNFYKENNIFLIWILDDFNVHKQGSFEKDLKYLSKHQNFFTLDEDSNNLHLKCEYKKVYIDNGIVKSNWKLQIINLNQLIFNYDELEVYYYDYAKNIKEKKIELIEFQKKQEEENWEKEQKKILESRKEKVQKLIRKIRDEKNKEYGFFKLFSKEISEFNFLEKKELNENLKLKTSKISPIVKWIKETNDKNYNFLFFILDTLDIEMDVNKVDSHSKSAFIELYSNKNNFFKLGICKLLFKRNYHLTQEDLDFINTLPKDKDFERILIFNRITNRNLVDDAFDNDSILFIMESAKFNKIIGSKPRNWIAFANNAIEFYGHFWEYLELAFKKYKIWEKIINEDRNKTFHSKLQNLYQNYPKQNYQIDRLIKDLYPEIFE